MDTYGVQWLWKGGVFTLPSNIKKEFKKMSGGNQFVYLKAKLKESIFLYICSELNFSLSTKNGRPNI
jgi:hypothetical protein